MNVLNGRNTEKYMQDSSSDGDRQEKAALILSAETLGIEPFIEDIWTFFDEEIFRNLENSRLVAVEKLIFREGDITNAKHPADIAAHPVYRAYQRFREAASGTIKPRAPIKVRDNNDETFTVLDGKATTSAAKILKWKILPVHITETANNTETI